MRNLHRLDCCSSPFAGSARGLGKRICEGDGVQVRVLRCDLLVFSLHWCQWDPTNVTCSSLQMWKDQRSAEKMTIFFGSCEGRLMPLQVMTVIATLLLFTNAESTAEISQQAKVPVCLLHMHDGASFFQEYGSVALANKRRYAARHGYEMASFTPQKTVGLLEEADCSVDGARKRQDGKCYVAFSQNYRNDRRAATFGKIKLTQHACVGRMGYWMLWSDADALVVNQSIKLEDSVIDDRFDFILTRDWLMLNAGMLLMKCSEWMLDFLQKVYNAEEFNRANALDQSSFQAHIDNLTDADQHVKFVPKHVMNVYTEEYRPGDFLLHMAGKLSEASEKGAVAIMRQFDTLSLADDIRDVEAFFNTRYLLNSYSGTCPHKEGEDCAPDNPRRLRLPEPLLAMSFPNRYRHVGERYYWLGDWKDVDDKPNWNEGRVAPKPIVMPEKEDTEPTPKGDAEVASGHDEL